MQSFSDEQSNVIALLFAAREPLTAKQLQRLGCQQVMELIEGINKVWEETNFPLYIAAIAGGFSLRTRENFAPIIEAMVGSIKERLSKASLEVLAIVAAKEPIARSEIEAIRGVDCSGLIQTLQDKDLIETIEQEGSRIQLFRVTSKLLEHFGLRHREELSLLAAASSGRPEDRSL